MNDKNEQDIFKDLIDRIHVEEDDGFSPGDPVQVPVRRTDRPAEEPPRANRMQPSQNGEKPSASEEPEEPPQWLTEKNRRPRSGDMPPERINPAQDKARPPQKSRGRAPEQNLDDAAENPPAGDAESGAFQVSISQKDYDRPSEMQKIVPPENNEAEPAPSAPKARKRKRIKKQYRVGRALLMTFGLLLLSVYLAFFAIHAFEDLTAVTLFGEKEPTEQQMTVKIPKGASVGEIAKILKKDGVITEPLAFRLYVMLKKKDGFQSGEYIMTDKMDYDSIIYALQAGNERTDVVDVMFLEGSTTVDIARKLEENGVCSASEFLAALNRSDFNYTFVENIPQNALRFYKLEGYLFPNTHQFFVGESVDSVINRFLRDFNEQITADMRTRMNELNLTLDETLALASIIQKEAGDPDEMKNVSEVFHNRLRNPDNYPNLQSDPTIFYVEQVIKKNIGMANQAMYDAYNTYVCNGLPVGPICNPGLDAINAALYPAQHEETYYYFVTDDAGTYYYAQTLSEHNANIAQADKVNAELAASSSSAAS